MTQPTPRKTAFKRKVKPVKSDLACTETTDLQAEADQADRHVNIDLGAVQVSIDSRQVVLAAIGLVGFVLGEIFSDRDDS